MFEAIVEFIKWFFSLKMDAVTLPWVDANKITIGFFLGAPYMIYRWYRNSVNKIKNLDTELDKQEAGDKAEG